MLICLCQKDLNMKDSIPLQMVYDNVLKILSLSCFRYLQFIHLSSIDICVVKDIASGVYRRYTFKLELHVQRKRGAKKYQINKMLV